MKQYQCECGGITEHACEWQGEISEMVVIEWMPKSIRSSHEAAGNSGRYPRNGSIRLAVHQDCAASIVDDDPDWSHIAQAPAEQYATQVAHKDDVIDWETVTTYGATFPSDDGTGACDVEIQTGQSDGIWFVRTRDDAGGSDEADDVQYATEADARTAAQTLAEALDDCDGQSAEEYLTAKLEARAKDGVDPAGDYALYWETALEDAGERTRYCTYAAAQAAAALAQAQFQRRHPSSGGTTYLCGYSVRRLVAGAWVQVDEDNQS
jgi:hypothetical protein